MMISDTTETTISECPNAYTHAAKVAVIRAEALLKCKLLRLERSHINLIEPARDRRTALRKLDADVSKIDLKAIRSRRRLDDEFKLQWFLWRAALPISLVTGILPASILFGGRVAATVRARRICLWLTWGRGRFSYPSLGKAMRCDHSTVRHSVLTVEGALKDPDSPLYLLLQDALQAEMGIAGPQEGNLRSSDRRRSSRA